MIEQSRPILRSISKAEFKVDGAIGRRLEAVTRQWLLPAPFANPAMLEMFRNRERRPYQDQVPWAGEFAGKYLTHAVQIWRLTRDGKLGEHLKWFVKELVALQAEDGYLGPWPEPWRLRHGAPNCEWPWDAWGHYHAMVGLLLWHEQTGDRAALRCVRRMADLMCRRFMNGKPERMHDTGAHEMNQAPIHALAWLYRLTGEKRYLDMVRTIEQEFEMPPAGDYLRTALAGKEFFQTPKPRWESLHPIMGLAELYYATGLADYRKAFEHLWWSMLKTDRHNNGGFTSGEQAQGTPYHAGAIETCCTVAWMAMSVEMLRMTGESIVADELELAMFNSGLGMMSPSGRWVTYNTPMDGFRRASAHDIVFQARPGSPELNCCSVNGPRALGMLCEWAVMRADDGLALNYYGPCRVQAALASGNRVTLVQETDYPRKGDVRIHVKPSRAEMFTLRLRIPAWSERTVVRVNGKGVPGVQPGRYLDLNRRWRTGDTIRLTLDFRPHIWVRPATQGAFDLDLAWQVFGPVPRRPEDRDAKQAPLFPTEPALEGLTAIPGSIRVNGNDYRPVAVRSRDGLLSGRELFPKTEGLPVLFAFAEWDVAEAQELELCFTADWWTAWYINGEKVFDNHATGGDRGDFQMRHNRVAIRLKQGRNLLALRLSGGVSRGCWLSAGRGALRGERVASGSGVLRLASVYRGPVLLASDPRYLQAGQSESPVLDANRLVLKPVTDRTWLKPWMLFEAKDAAGRPVRLCDYASAGAAGNAVQSWLPVRVKGDPGDTFTRRNPLRTLRF